MGHLLVPLFISAFRRADELAIGMEARCYRGGVNRTRMKELQSYLCRLYRRRSCHFGTIVLTFYGGLIEKYKNYSCL